MQQDDLSRYILESTEGVFSTMLGLEVTAREPRIAQGKMGPSLGVAALVGLAGPWIGNGSVDCSATLACTIAGAMLGNEYQAVNDDVLDAMGEVANMIMGNIKTSAEAMVGPLDLSIPTVVYGCNFTTRHQKQNQWTVVPFLCQGEEFQVQVMLIPNSSEAPRPEAAVPEAAVLEMAPSLQAVGD